MVTPEIEKKPKNDRYKGAGDGLEKVCSEYEFWSGKFTEMSQQICFVLIGANWVMFGSTAKGLLGNVWPKLSVIAAIMALGVHFVGAWRLSEKLRIQNDYGEANPDRWAREFNEYRQKGSPWPFTKSIENTGKRMRLWKMICIGLSGALLVVGVFLK
jgi:hypothetical protein